jgi:glycosyltransferase involved in cell wall biosynthesis
MNKSTVNKLEDAHVPLVSVVLPIYNGEKYLTEAIDSILAQTFSDFELIIIDDGSTDTSLTILQKYQNRDERIRLISRENRNLATTLNDLIDMARGKWIARMDQDDISLPLRLERQLHWLEVKNADLCGCWVKFFGRWDHHTWKGWKTDRAIKADMMFKSPFVHPSVMMRTDLVRRLRYDRSYEKAEDYDLWVRAAMSGWNMCNIPEVLLLYRNHSSQISVKSAQAQKNLGESIQIRFWHSMSELYELESNEIEEILKLANAKANVDMDVIEATFKKLLRQNIGEARAVIMNNAAKLYLRNADINSEMGARWRLLNRLFGSGFGVHMSLTIWMIKKFKIQANGRLFNLLKSISLAIRN